MIHLYIGSGLLVSSREVLFCTCSTSAVLKIVNIRVLIFGLLHILDGRVSTMRIDLEIVSLVDYVGAGLSRLSSGNLKHEFVVSRIVLKMVMFN